MQLRIKKEEDTKTANNSINQEVATSSLDSPLEVEEKDVDLKTKFGAISTPDPPVKVEKEEVDLKTILGNGRGW